MKLDSLLAGFLGALAGLALGYTLAPSAPPAPADGGHPEFEAMLGELQQIRTELQKPRPAQPAAPAERADLQPPAPVFDEEALMSALGGLEQSMREANSLQRLMTNNMRGTGSDWREEGEGRPAETAAVRALRPGLDPEHLAADTDHFGLSAAQLYERYGTPDHIGAGGDRVRWMYYDPETNDYVVFTFIDHYVAWIHVTD